MEQRLTELKQESLPSNEKTREQYWAVWNDFKKYLQQNDYEMNSDTVFLYLDHLRQTKNYAPSTLMSKSSALSAYLLIEQGQRLEKFAPEAYKWVKRLYEEHTPKQASIFSKSDLEKFWREAPNEGQLLLLKVISVIGYYGTLRSNAEIDTVSWNGLTKVEDGYWFNANKAKQRKKEKQVKKFFIPRLEDTTTCPSAILDAYISKIENDKVKKQGKFFKTFRSNKDGGKFINQNYGLNKINPAGMAVAEYLQKKNPEGYTGHCWRRSSATAMVDGGASIEEMKRQGCWKSTAALERYIDESEAGKKRMASILAPEQAAKKKKLEVEGQQIVLHISGPVHNLTINKQ